MDFEWASGIHMVLHALTGMQTLQDGACDNCTWIVLLDAAW